MPAPGDTNETDNTATKGKTSFLLLSSLRTSPVQTGFYFALNSIILRAAMYIFIVGPAHGTPGLADLVVVPVAMSDVLAVYWLYDILRRTDLRAYVAAIFIAMPLTLDLGYVGWVNHLISAQDLGAPPPSQDAVIWQNYLKKVPQSEREAFVKSVRLDELKLADDTVQSGSPVPFSFVLANTGQQAFVLPGEPERVADILMGWEALSDGATKPRIFADIPHFGNAIVIDTVHLWGLQGNSLTPGERAPLSDTLYPHATLAPGRYRLHLFLLSAYAADDTAPFQDLTHDFTVK